MKLRILVLVLILSTFTVASFAQEKSSSNMFDVVVSAKENTFPFYSKTIPFNVKITNRSENVISTKQLGWVRIILSRESIFIDEFETAFMDVDSKHLKKGETLDFQVDLKEVWWLENPRSSYLETDPEKITKHTPLFLGKNTLSVIIENCRKVGSADSLSKIKYGSCESNKIPLNFESEVKED